MNELEEVLNAVKSVLDDAEKTLKQIQEEKKNRFYFLLNQLIYRSRFSIWNPFRSQNHVEEIKSHQEKLKTLTPILNLAMNSIHVIFKIIFQIPFSSTNQLKINPLRWRNNIMI